MVFSRWLGSLPIRYRLFFTYSTVLLLAVGVGMMTLDSYVRRALEEHTDTELERSTGLVIKMVRTAAAVSIKNHLRATAEDNREIVGYYHQQYVSGKLTEAEAKEAARSVLLSQRIGKTGYIFVWDIRNAPKSIILSVHPKIQGQEVSDINFVQEGVRLKNGYLEYQWRNPDEDHNRDKAMYLAYFEPWDWIIAVSSYKDEFLELIDVGDIRDSILSVSLERTGYCFVIDSTGNLIIHPKIEGNAYDFTDKAGRIFIQEMCSKKRGKLDYSWKNPGEAAYRSKLVFFDYIPEYDWIVGSSGYRDEFNAPLYTVRSIVLFVTGLIVLIVLLISFVAGRFINAPLQRLVDVFESKDATNLTARLPVTSMNEIGRLALHFNRFMDNLEQESIKRRTAEHALQVSEERFKTLFRSSPGAIVFASLEEGRIYEANEAYCRLFGYSRDEVIGRTGIELGIWPNLEDRKVVKDVLASQGSVSDYECHLSNRYGEIITTLISVEILEMDNRRCMLVVTKDITERKRAEEERMLLERRLQQAQKAESLGRMAGAIAHHFNNMLGVVMGNLELALADLDQPPGIRSEITRALEASSRAAEISRFMLTYVGQTARKKEPLDFGEAVRETLPLLSGSLPGNVHLEAEPLPTGLIINADGVHIKQVLTNLVSNAMEAIGEREGDINLSIGVMAAPQLLGLRYYPLDWEPKAESYACLTISDNGCGMDAPTLEKIFDPFFSFKFTGRGLGLAVVLGIIRAHEGAITTESQAGLGSTFRVFFPMSAREVLRSQTQKVLVSEAHESRGSILVVDDEPLLRDMAQSMIEHLGYEAAMADDGFAAVEIFQARKDEFSLVLLDLSMPGMNGWQTLAALRALQPDIPVILSSGYDEAQVMRDDRPQQTQAFLHKPYQIADLKAALGKALQLKT